MRLIKFLNHLFAFRYFYYLKYRYRSYPRFKEATLKLRGKTIKVPDMASFLAKYEEISQQPFVQVNVYMNFDNQLNSFVCR